MIIKKTTDIKVKKIGIEDRTEVKVLEEGMTKMKETVVVIVNPGMVRKVRNFITAITRATSPTITTETNIMITLVLNPKTKTGGTMTRKMESGKTVNCPQKIKWLAPMW
jgi:hypothetical protein